MRDESRDSYGRVESSSAETRLGSRLAELIFFITWKRGCSYVEMERRRWVTQRGSFSHTGNSKREIPATTSAKSDDSTMRLSPWTPNYHRTLRLNRKLSESKVKIRRFHPRLFYTNRILISEDYELASCFIEIKRFLPARRKFHENCKIVEGSDSDLFSFSLLHLTRRDATVELAHETKLRFKARM